MRSCHLEAVGQMPDLVKLAFLQQHLNDVKADLHLGISQQAQVIKSSPCQAPLSLCIDGGSRPLPIFGRAGFYFDENKAIPIAKYQVDFPAG